MKTASLTKRWLLIMVMVVAPAAYAAPPQQTGNTSDEVDKYSFRLEIDGVDAGRFTAVEGIGIEQEVIEYQNGDDPLTRKRPGRVKYSNITLKRGYTMSTTLNDWIEAARVGNGDYTRRNMSLILLDPQGAEIKRWNMFECFPVSWTLSPLDLDNGKQEVVETLVVAIEWFEEA